MKCDLKHDIQKEKLFNEQEYHKLRVQATISKTIYYIFAASFTTDDTMKA